MTPAGARPPLASRGRPARSNLELGPADLADVRRSTQEALARQSVAGLGAHAVLAVVLLGTLSAAHAYPATTIAGGVWMGLVCVYRLIVARSFPRVYASRPLLWTRLFRAGLVLSSTTWGVGGALLLVAGGFDRESSLVLMTLAGISAGAMVSLSGDRALLRLHVALLLAPSFVAGVLFLPGGVRLVASFAVIVASFAAFLWVQGAHTHDAAFGGLVDAKLLERHAAELDARPSRQHGGEPRQVRVPREHEPRDPHPDDRGHRLRRSPARPVARRRASASTTCRPSAATASTSCRSSTTSSTSRRSRPAR